MAQAPDPNARKDFISRIGTFFIVISIFALIIFAASDIARNDPSRKAGATQTYFIAYIQAVQTRDAGATQAASLNLPAPTLAPVNQSNSDNILYYLPAFCLGSVGLLVGWFFKRISAPPPKPGNRFEGIRKMQQKQREAKAAMEAKKKEQKQQQQQPKKK